LFSVRVSSQLADDEIDRDIEISSKVEEIFISKFPDFETSAI
jgi:hypothetical protein